MKQFYEVKNINITKDMLILTIGNSEFSFLLNDVSDKLSKANAVERNAFEISPSGYGIHWPLIDEDLSVDAILKISEQK